MSIILKAYTNNPQYVSPGVYITLLPYYLLLVSQCLVVAGLRGGGGPEGHGPTLLLDLCCTVTC